MRLTGENFFKYHMEGEACCGEFSEASGPKAVEWATN